MELVNYPQKTETVISEQIRKNNNPIYTRAESTRFEHNLVNQSANM